MQPIKRVYRIVELVECFRVQRGVSIFGVPIWGGYLKMYKVFYPTWTTTSFCSDFSSMEEAKRNLSKYLDWTDGQKRKKRTFPKYHKVKIVS